MFHYADYNNIFAIVICKILTIIKNANLSVVKPFLFISY